uniref:Uncharacterized protein n=1 Tax=Oryza barthii TaxID=65489 RepID=A0A0D3GGH3_9ORYZ
MLVYNIFVEGYNVQRNRIRLLPPEDTDKQGPPTIGQIYDMQLAPPAHLTVLLALKDFVASSDIAGELVKEAKTLWEKLRDGIACTNQEVMAAVDYLRRKEPTRSVPLHAPTYGTNPWQGQFMDYSGTSFGAGVQGYMDLLQQGFRPYTASYGDISSFGGGSSSVPDELRASQTNEAPQATQLTQPEVGDLQGNDNDPRRSNHEHLEPNRLSLSGPRHAAGARKKTKKSELQHLEL